MFCVLKIWNNSKNGLKKNRKSFVYVYNCGGGCICHEKKLSNAPLRATLGTLRAGSPFRVLPQPSLEGMSALSTPSASRTQPYGWGPKSNSKIQTPRSRIQNTKNPKSYPKPLWANHTLKTKKTPHGRET